jgi:hypothetical protein
MMASLAEMCGGLSGAILSGLDPLTAGAFVALALVYLLGMRLLATSRPDAERMSGWIGRGVVAAALLSPLVVLGIALL